MPRGRKKSAPETKAVVETAAEITPAVPAEDKVETAEKAPKKRGGRKPKAEKAAPAAEKSKAKPGRKPKAEKTATAKNVTESPAVSAPAPAESKAKKSKAKKAAPVVEKIKRAYNKKDNSVLVQGANGEYSMNDLTEVCKKAYRNGTKKQIKTIKVYIKSENGGIRAYYVINDKENGFVDL